MVCQCMDDPALRWSHRRREYQSFALLIVFKEQELGIETKGGWVIQIYFCTIFSVNRALGPLSLPGFPSRAESGDGEFAWTREDIDDIDG